MLVFLWEKGWSKAYIVTTIEFNKIKSDNDKTRICKNVQ